MKQRARFSADPMFFAGRDRQRSHQPEAALVIRKGGSSPGRLCGQPCKEDEPEQSRFGGPRLCVQPTGPAIRYAISPGGCAGRRMHTLCRTRGLPEGVGGASATPIKRRRQATLAVGGCVGDNRSSASRIVARDPRDAGKARLGWRHAERRHGLNPDEQHDDEYGDRPGRENTAPVPEILISPFLFACLLHAR
jgi:hypothetical protein